MDGSNVVRSVKVGIFLVVVVVVVVVTVAMAADIGCRCCYCFIIVVVVVCFPCWLLFMSLSLDIKVYQQLFVFSVEGIVQHASRKVKLLLCSCSVMSNLR